MPIFWYGQIRGSPANRALTGLRQHHLGSDQAMLCISSAKLPTGWTFAVSCPVPHPCEELPVSRWRQLDYWILTYLSNTSWKEQGKWGSGEERNCSTGWVCLSWNGSGMSNSGLWVLQKCAAMHWMTHLLFKCMAFTKIIIKSKTESQFLLLTLFFKLRRYVSLSMNRSFLMQITSVNILDLEVLFVLFISVIFLGYVISCEVKKGFSKFAKFIPFSFFLPMALSMLLASKLFLHGYFCHFLPFTLISILLGWYVLAP